MSDKANGLDREFLRAVQSRLDAIEREEELLAAQEEGVRRKREALQHAMTKYRAAIEVYREVSAKQEHPSPGQLTVEPGPTSTIADLIAEFLARHGGRARVTEMAAWLAEVGRLPSEADKYNSNYSTVYTALLRDPRFHKADRGVWAMSGSGSQMPLTTA